MKSPSSRFLLGYTIRAILGTVLVLCAISAVRIRLIPDRLIQETAPPWDKAMILPDQFVTFLFAKYDARQGEDAPPAPPSPLLDPPPSLPSSPPPTVASTGLPEIPAPPTMPTMPSMPSMPDTPGIPSAPGLPDMPSPPAVTAESGGWGVTVAPQARVYNLEGKSIGLAPAGSLFKVLASKTSSKGDLIVCTVVVDGKKHPRAIIREGDVVLHGGALADTTAEQRSLCVRHAKLLAGIQARETQLRDASTGNNPHKAEYAKASRAYKQFAKRNNALLKEYEAASGPRRMELANELRSLKLARPRIEEAYQSAKSKYAAWKDQAPPAEAPDLEGDSELQRLRQEVAKVERQLNTL